MNTHTLTISTVEADFKTKILLSTINLYNVTKVTLDISNMYSEIFPNYVSIDWGDKSAILEPDILIYRDYRTQSIFPEIQKGATPVTLSNTYNHIYYPSNYALKKSLTFKMNIGYVTGDTTQLSAPIVVNSESYYESIGDMEIIGIDLLNDGNNTSRFSFVTETNNYVVQLDNKSYKEKQV